MNSKTTTNSQLSTNEAKRKEKTMEKKPEQTTRTGTESEKWTSHGGLSVGSGEGRVEEKVQEMRSINVRYKIDRGRLIIV